MLVAEAPYSIHQRFAKYYVNRLNALADKLDTKDDTSFIDAVTLLDEDLDQIRQAIQWLNTLSAEDSELAHIAMSLLKVNMRLLMLRLTSDELMACTKTALEAARQFQDEEVVRQCLYQLALAYRDTDRYDDSIDCLEELLASSQQNADRRNEARAWFLFGSIDTVLSRPVQARQKLEKAIALLKEIGDRSDIYGISIATLGNTYSSEGKHEIAIPLQQEALALFREQKDLFRVCYLLGNLGDDYVGLGRYAEALAALEEGIQIARYIHHNDSLGFLLGNTGYVSLRLGQIKAAESYLEESVMVCQTLNKVVGKLLFSAFLFHIQMTVENLHESCRQFCTLISQAAERQILSVLMVLLTVVAKWHLLRNEPVRSMQLLDYIGTRPEPEHECLYFIEQVRHEIATLYPNLQPVAPLEQTLEEIVADILANCD